MIKCNKLTFSYSRKYKVFDEIDLELKAGHVYGLLGKNGEGKTTLLKLISGLLIPDSGLCCLWGENVKFRPVELLQKLFFVQENPLYPDVRVNEFFSMYAPFYPTFSSDILNTCIEQFEIDRSAKVKKLSYGQQKKVLITMALSSNTPILLFDEPTNGLDIPSKRIFRKLLASQVSDEQTVILSTHQVRDLDSLIDSVVIVEKGKIIYNESLDNTTSSLEELFEQVVISPNLQVI